MKSKLFVIIPVVLILWLASGFYTVDSGEEALVFRFGRHVSTVSSAGLKWRVPRPVETVQKEKVSEIKRLEFGFRTLKPGDKNRTAEYKSIPEEALMLTGDENLVLVETIIQFQITDIEKFLLNVDDPLETLRMAGESTIRRVVASHSLDEVLTENKFAIQQAIKDDLQVILEKYRIGVAVNAVQLQDVNPPMEVDAAFKDVASAREDKNSYINQAQSYENEVIPKARGNAAELLNKAEAFKTKRVEEAHGDVARFIQILEKYQSGKDVTRTRLYLETMEEILPGIKKYIVDGKGNTLQFLPLTDGGVVR